MKALLISLQDYREQLGLKTLHYNLIANGFDSTLFYLKYFDNTCKLSVASVKAFFLNQNPAFIGVSLMSIDYHKAVAVTRIIREVLPETPIVWGGIHPSIYPEMCLQHADYVVSGEAEKTIIELAEAARVGEGFEKINNVCYMHQGQLFKNPLNPPLENLDSLSPYEHVATNCFVLHDKKVQKLTFPLFKSYDKNRGNSYSVVTSRGCPFACTYCCNNFYKNLYNYNKIRRRSVNHIIAELENAVKTYPELEFINFEDDSFLSGPTEYIREFAEKYAARLNKPFIVHSIPISISEEKIVLLKKAGLAWVNVGLQSGSDYILNEVYKRKSLTESFLKATQILQKHHIAAFYDVLVDNPYEKHDDRIATLKAVYNIPKPYIIRVFSLTFYPGSELYDRFVKDYPEHKEAYLSKNFCLPTSANYNEILKMMPFIFKWQARWLMHAYNINPEGKNLRMAVRTLKYINVLFIKPFRHLKLINMSYGGRLSYTLPRLHFYFVHYISKHLPEFSFLRNKGMLPF